MPRIGYADCRAPRGRWVHASRDCSRCRVSKHLMRRLPLAAVAIVISALITPATAQAAQQQDWGAIAYSPSTGVAATALANGSDEATVAAVDSCRNSGGGDDCWALLWYFQAVGKLARASDGSYGSGFGYSDDLADADERAEQEAIGVCEYYGGRDCTVILTHVTDVVSSSGGGRALSEPNQNLFDYIDDFNWWLNACLQGELDFDPGCREAAQEAANANFNITTIPECVTLHADDPVGVITCIGWRIFWTLWTLWWESPSATDGSAPSVTEVDTAIMGGLGSSPAGAPTVDFRGALQGR
ncbi:DUF4189 domain-containing protein [Geodermatophilus sp. SYSU D00703]